MLNRALVKDVERYILYRHQTGTFHGMMEIPFMKHFIREELDVKGTAVLDIGCGFGFYAKYFLEQGANTVECIDKNPAMIELARKYVSSHRAKYLVADMDELQARNRFDIAFAKLSLSDAKDLKKVYRNVREAMRQKAFFLVSEVHPIATVLRYNGKDEYTTFGCDYFSSTIGIQDYINIGIQSGFTLKMYHEPKARVGASQIDSLIKRANLFPRFFVLLFQKE